MQTEDFDDAIRRKIQSVNSSHDLQEVDLVHRNILAQKAAWSKYRYAAIGFSFAVLLIVSGLLTWNIFQVKETNKLEQTLKNLKINLAQLEIENKQLKNKKDTLFITKYLNRENATVAHTDISNERSGTNSLANLPDSKLKNSYVNLQRQTNTLNVNAKTVTAIGGTITMSNGSNTPSDILNKSISTSPSDQDKTLTKVPEKTVMPELNKGSDSLTQNTIINKPIGAATDSSLIENKMDEPAVFVKNWGYRVGLGFEAGNLQLGYSVLGEALFRRHWGLSAGLKMLKNGDETFDDEDDFNTRKKKEFKTIYENQVHDTSNQHIRIKNTVFQIPLTVSYYLPLKNNLTLLFGVGTDIDIYIKQHVEYKHALSSSDLQNRKFETNYSPVYFNNAVISTGVQKTIHRFAFQLCPYFSPQLRQVTYKKENIYYGLKLRALYEF